jgi:ubiquinol-cytochrome c reductase iron-sulfur subunit
VSRFVKFILALGALRGLRKRVRPERRKRIVEPGEAPKRAELTVVGLLLLCALFAVGFVVVYAADGISSSTQFEGVALGGALLCLSAALIVTAKRLVVTEQIEEDYPGSHPEEQEQVAQIVEEGGTPITRKKLLGGAAALAGGALGTAMLAPAASMGPALSSHILLETPWRRGRRVVREDNVPVKAADIEQGTFYSGFAEGAPHDLLGAPLVIVRLDPSELQLPPERGDWAPEGIVAYSKICTHMGCPVALYEQQTHHLLCPCHQSTFDVTKNCKVVFGPAKRPLPQLAITVDTDGYLVAKEGFREAVGPSFWERG